MKYTLWRLLCQVTNIKTMEKVNLKKFGKKIKIERIRNDISQEQFAELLGVSTRTISLIENGHQHPKFFLVVNIAKKLDLDVNFFAEE